MFCPEKLKKGDTIALIGASSPVPDEKIEPSIKAMEDLGLKVILGESCTKKHGYFSGNDLVRANDINTMFANKDVNGVFCIRGGYGSQRLLDLIDYEMIKANKKMFTGYSDVTALHIAFNQKCDLITYHSPMASTEICDGLDDYTMKYYKKAIFEDSPMGIIENPKGQIINTLVEGEATGELIGGNLALVSSSLGTAYEINTKGKILFLEDIDELPHRIDRMLTQLRLAGKFHDCAGIIFGGFTKCEPKNIKNSLTLAEIFDEIIKPINKPTLTNVACGHVLPTMTLPMGAVANIGNGKIEIL